MTFNSNVQPKTVKTDRGDKNWQCYCGKENRPYHTQCPSCGKRKD